MTAHKVELLTRHRRAEEQRVKELIKYTNDCQRLSMAVKGKNDKETHEKNRLTLIDQFERNKKTVGQIEKPLFTIEGDSGKGNYDDEEQRVSEERLKEERLEREIIRICESNEELKELERTIQVAYVNKERAAQHKESLMLKRIENAREQMIVEEMEKRRLDLIRVEEEKERRRRDNLVAQKNVLQQQMILNEVRY